MKFLNFVFLKIGRVAQLVERRTENPCVGGSIPSLTTKIIDLNFQLKNYMIGVFIGLNFTFLRL